MYMYIYFLVSMLFVNIAGHHPTVFNPRTEVHFERMAERKHTASKLREGMKPRDIYVKYPDKKKADELIGRLFKAGMFHYDPDFPQDREDQISNITADQNT